jgi:hypothetical protein
MRHDFQLWAEAHASDRGRSTMINTGRARVWASVAVGCAMSVLLGGCAVGALRSGGSVRATTATASRSLSVGAVSCFSSSACTAIGSLYAGSRREAVAERWNGSSWSAQRIPTPADSDLLSLSCPSQTLCFAVGYASVLAPDGDLKKFIQLVERWAGGSWSMQSTPRIPAANLNDISCASPDACTAIGGSGLPSSTGTRPLVERWDGTSWSIQRSAGRADVVSCPSRTGCVAVGISLSGFAVAERWNGSRWSRRRLPSGYRQSFGFLNISGLSCSSMSACTAVGFWGECAGGPVACPVHGRTWVLNRSRWSVHSVSDAGYDTVSFSDASYDTVSCVSANWCAGTAVGQLRLWTGKRWSTMFKLRGRGHLAGVSCTSITACIAVSDDGKVVEQWNGKSWKRVAALATTLANS